MIKISIFDTITPLLAEMQGRTHGMAQESLQVAGSKVAAHARKSMSNFKHHWLNAVINGKYVEWESATGVKELGIRISHTQEGNGRGNLGAVMNPKSMQSLVGFYLAPHSLTVVVGGGHPKFRPMAFKHGLPNGYYGEAQPAVGKKGRAILHKMNTGEVTSENPYSGTEKADIDYTPRPFMDLGLVMARGDISRSLTDRFEKSFKIAMNEVEVTGIWRKAE